MAYLGDKMAYVYFFIKYLIISIVCFLGKDLHTSCKLIFEMKTI